jgi:hypothetical protein
MYGKYHKSKENEKTFKDIQKSMSLKLNMNKTSTRLKKQSIQYDTLLVGGRFDNLISLY